ncbi:methyltransferase domain-containing protein [Flavitalea sp.]|nr:methyltransferase domain-containing protein [Flavitalea sp.]
MKWNPGTYNNFRSERMRPFYDCVQLIELRPSMDVIDLGCGMGDLTLKLAEYLPEPKTVLGVDSSAEMLLESSRYKHDKLSFRQGGIEDQLKDNKKWDLIFSHAAIQWIADHRSLMSIMISRLKPGGQLLIQMPAQYHNITNRILVELADTKPYCDALQNWNRRSPVLDPGEYGEILFRNGGQNIQVFEKIYPVVVNDSDDLYDWVSGTTLIPYLERLNDDAAIAFVAEFKMRLKRHFSQSPVFYPFKRIIMSASF